MKRSPLAWLRDVPEAPGANNLNEIIERLTQAQDKIERVTGIRPGIEMAEQRAKADDPIVIATVQTLARGLSLEGSR